MNTSNTFKKYTLLKKCGNAFSNIFERHTLLNKLEARRKFYIATMLADERILAYTNRIRQLASTRKSMGFEIDDKEMAMDRS